MSPNPPPQPPPQQPYNYGPPPQQPYGYPPQQPYGYPQQPYGYPVPMAPPMVYGVAPTPPGAKTFEGIGRLKTGLLLVIFYGILNVITGLVILTILPTATNPAAALGNILLIGGMGIVTGLVGLIGFVLGLWGLWTMHDGRAEFGPAHVQAVEKGAKNILYGIVVSFAGGVALVVITFMLAFNAGLTGDFAALRTATIIGVAVGGAIGILSTYLFALGLQGFVERLMTRMGREKRQMFIMLSLIGAGVSMALGVLSFVLFDPFNPAITNPSSLTLAPLAGIVSILTMWIYRQQVMDAETGARTMVTSGQYDPDGGTGAPPGMAAQAPPQMVAQMAPQQPMAPPPPMP